MLISCQHVSSKMLISLQKHEMFISHQHISSKKLISLQKQSNVDSTKTRKLKDVNFTSKTVKC